MYFIWTAVLGSVILLILWCIVSEQNPHIIAACIENNALCSKNSQSALLYEFFINHANFLTLSCIACQYSKVKSTVFFRNWFCLLDKAHKKNIISCADTNYYLVGGIQMDVNSLSHTRWNCKYHIVFAPKYRRKVAYEELKQTQQIY